MEAGKVNILTAVLDQGYLGPAGMWSFICKMHVTLLLLLRNFVGGKILLRISVFRVERRYLKKMQFWKLWISLRWTILETESLQLQPSVWTWRKSPQHTELAKLYTEIYPEHRDLSMPQRSPKMLQAARQTMTADFGSHAEHKGRDQHGRVDTWAFPSIESRSNLTKSLSR